MAQTNGQTDNHTKDDYLVPADCWGIGVCADTNCIRERLLDIKKHIAPCKPRIIGVTKYYGLDSILRGYEAGLRDFGESRVLDAIKKIESLPNNIRESSTFHFIGHLQTNKAEKAVKYFDYIHSVDSLKLAKVISKISGDTNRQIKILLQVNNAGEEQKSGYSKAELLKDLPEILKLDNLDVAGLMNIAPLGASEQTLRALFRDIADFRTELEKKFDIKLNELSMGMSDDYEIAVSEGATMIRIGRKLFI
jgi:pyridoxal phosphate enzyme (YggS family)